MRSYLLRSINIRICKVHVRTRSPFRIVVALKIPGGGEGCRKLKKRKYSRRSFLAPATRTQPPNKKKKNTKYASS